MQISNSPIMGTEVSNVLTCELNISSHYITKSSVSHDSNFFCSNISDYQY